MKKKNKTGILVDGSLRSAGVTFYTRNGQTIVRTAVSMQPMRRTRRQFVSRQRLAHCNNLWSSLNPTIAPLLTQGRSPYGCFCALAAKLPAVYLTEEELGSGAALLLPGLPVSCGTLPDIACRLGEADGQPALRSDLTAAALAAGDDFCLVEVRQQLVHGRPTLAVATGRVAPADWTPVDGRLALVGNRFGDTMSGWALVRRRDSLCSTQRLVTHCRHYEPYTTPAALQRAAASYGGLTPPP